ncbi:MAG: Aminopeptidase [Bacteroidetes bacterium]|nr:Aminopeptidase [Bacteroidota bacterium]
MRKKIFLGLFLALVFYSVKATDNPAQIKRLEKHIYYFAADSLNGRKTGSIDNKNVASYIKSQFEEIGLVTTYQYIDKDSTQQNVIGVLEGNDPVLKHEIIVIGAHFDHLGVKLVGNTNQIYNGADDNASGSAALIEIARQMVLKKDLLKRTIIFVAFDAEEIGLVGSGYYIKDFFAHNQNDKVVIMTSIDMVGYLKQSGKLKISGVKTIKDHKLLFNQVPFDSKFDLVLEDFDNSILTGSDHGPFLSHKIPALHATTGLKSPYHKPEDDANLIDYEGLSEIVDYFTALNYTFAVANQFESSGKFGNSAFAEKNNYFGIIGGIGNNQHYYSNGRMTGKQGLALCAGLYGKVSIAKYMALKGEVDYEYKIGNRYEGELYTHSVSVPLTLFAKVTLQNIVEYDFGFGGYYTYNFAGKLDSDPINFSIYNHHEYGCQIELEMRMATILFSVQWKYAFNNVMINPIKKDMSKAQGFYFRIGYLF